MQGVFSGVWGVSSVVGPLLGGFLVDQVSWHWVFFINVLPGLLALALVWRAWVDRPRAVGAARPAVDYAGAALLTVSVVVLLLGLFEFGTPIGWALLLAALLLFAVLAWVERRAADPVLPLPLFRDRLFAIACLHGVLAGWAMFGSARLCAAVRPGGAGHQRHRGRRDAHAAADRLGALQHCRQPAAADSWVSYDCADRHGAAGDRRVYDDAGRRDNRQRRCCSAAWR